MASLKALRTDTLLEQEGIWVDYEAGVRVKVARLSNTKFEQALRTASKPHLRQIRSKRAPLDLIENLTREAAARHILLGWENLDDDDGTPIPYSPERALEIFNDPTLHDFYKFVMQISTDSELYRREDMEESLGNSQAGSNGTSSSEPSKSS